MVNILKLCYGLLFLVEYFLFLLFQSAVPPDFWSIFSPHIVPGLCDWGEENLTKINDDYLINYLFSPLALFSFSPSMKELSNITHSQFDYFLNMLFPLCISVSRIICLYERIFFRNLICSLPSSTRILWFLWNIKVDMFEYSGSSSLLIVLTSLGFYI